MISAATGTMALLMITLVKDHGLEYLFAATILTGVLQVLFGVFRLSGYMKFVPRPVMVGFINALAILIFLAQLPQFIGAGWMMYAFVAAGLGEARRGERAAGATPPPSPPPPRLTHPDHAPAPGAGAWSSPPRRG